MIYNIIQRYNNDIFFSNKIYLAQKRGKVKIIGEEKNQKMWRLGCPTWIIGKSFYRLWAFKIKTPLFPSGCHGVEIWWSVQKKGSPFCFLTNMRRVVCVSNENFFRTLQIVIKSWPELGLELGNIAQRVEGGREFTLLSLCLEIVWKLLGNCLEIVRKCENGGKSNENSLTSLCFACLRR